MLVPRQIDGVAEKDEKTGGSTIPENRVDTEMLVLLVEEPMWDVVINDPSALDESDGVVELA